MQSRRSSSRRQPPASDRTHSSPRPNRARQPPRRLRKAGRRAAPECLKCFLRQTGFNLCCHACTPGSGDRPCSAKTTCPSALKTRRISRRAWIGLGIEQSVHARTMVSMFPYGSGISSAECVSSSTGNGTLFSFGRAIWSSSDEGSMPHSLVTRGP